MECFAMELLKQSPAPALRAAQLIAEVHQPIVDDLFKPAFYFCWVITRGVEMGVASVTALELPPSPLSPSQCYYHCAILLQIQVELDEQDRKDMCDSVKAALNYDGITSKILQRILNLDEYMAKKRQPLPIDLVSAYTIHIYTAMYLLAP